MKVQIYGFKELLLMKVNVSNTITFRSTVTKTSGGETN